MQEVAIAVAAGVPDDPRQSLFEGIDRVPAATTIVFDRRGEARSTTYWAMDWDRSIRFPRDDDYVDAARELVDRAVARCLRLAGPVVAMLSGGLDSPGVSATAARLASPDRVNAITLVRFGIDAANLAKIFNHGFTTRKDGHGFGLHSGALAARNLGGRIHVASDGPGQGARFTLELPLAKAEVLAPAEAAA